MAGFNRVPTVGSADVQVPLTFTRFAASFCTPVVPFLVSKSCVLTAVTDKCLRRKGNLCNMYFSALWKALRCDGEMRRRVMQVGVESDSQYVGSITTYYRFIVRLVGAASAEVIVVTEHGSVA